MFYTVLLTSCILYQQSKIKTSMTQQTNTIAGTANFLSPQACDGRFNEASDIWAYGMILYEIGSKGKVPFSGMGDVQIWRHIEGRKMPDMAEIKSYFPEELKDVMVKCLGYEPKSRPQAIKIIKTIHPTSVIQKVGEIAMCTKQRLIILESKLEEITVIIERHHKENQELNETTWKQLQDNDSEADKLMKDLSSTAMLYVDRPEQPKVLNSVNSLLQNAIGPNGGELFHRTILELVMEGGVGSYIEGPIKKKDRCIAKVENDYGGNARSLVDILRGTITFESCGEMNEFLDSLKASINIRIIRFKDRVNNPGPSRYRDVLMNIKVVIDDNEENIFQVGELQLHLKSMYKLKAADHRTYDINRILNGEFSKLAVSNMENEGMVDVEDVSKCVELVTVTSKDDDNTVVDKVIENSDNITDIPAISKETLVTEAKEKTEEGKKVIEDDDLKFTSNGEIKINLMESTKVKELE